MIPQLLRDEIMDFIINHGKWPIDLRFQKSKINNFGPITSVLYKTNNGRLAQ